MISDTSYTDTPELITNRLHNLSYRVWSKNAMFIQKFVSSGEFETILGFIRPRGLEHVPVNMCSIEIKLFQEHEPIEIFDNWPCVLRGLSAKLIADTLRSVPSIIRDVLNSNPWITDRLLQMIESLSVVEKYGALTCLETIYWNGTARQGADFDYLVPHITGLFNMACEARRGLLNSMRWRLACWRACFDMIQTLSTAPNLDLMTSSVGSEIIQLREDWKRFNQGGKLLLSLMNIFKFAFAAIPKPEDMKYATMFSGPGLFKGSGLKLQDLEPIIRSTCFFIKRLSVNDEWTKQCLMRQSDMVTSLKIIGGYLAGNARADIVDLLLFMGVNNPVCHLNDQSIMSNLNSGDPREIFKALRILSHADHLVDAEQWEMLSKHHSIETVLANLMKSSPVISPQLLKEKLNNVKLQTDPIRELVVLQQPITWRVLLKSFAAYTLGRQLKFLNRPSIVALSKQINQLCSLAIQSIKVGCDLEKWAMSEFLAGAIVSSSQMINFHEFSQSEDMIYASYKLLNISYGPKSIFASTNDLQFKFETWTNGCMIIKEMMKQKFREDKDNGILLEFMSEIHQIGIVPALFEILKQIATLFDSKYENEETKNVQSGLQVPKQKNSEIPVEYRYRNDHTLPSLIYTVMDIFLCLAQKDKFTRDVLLWESSLCVLEVYLYFAQADVRFIVMDIFSELMSSLKQEAPKRSSKQQTSSRKLSLHALQSATKYYKYQEKLWPSHLHERQINSESPNGSQSKEQFEREYGQCMFIKCCANTNCFNRELRSNQFFLQKNANKWFCSKACAIINKN